MTLAEKYRPRKFAEFYGNRETIMLVKKVLLKKDRPHVYLISGPFGVGKTSLARIMAMALNCSGFEQNEDVCCRCEGCDMVLKGGPDFCEIDGATYRGIQDARRIKELSVLKPWSVKNRVIVIDECHQLTDEAVSSLLKSLESVVETTYFILVTTEKFKVKPTVRSRAFQIDLKFPTSAVIRQFLHDVCKKEGIEPLEINADEFISFRDALYFIEGGRERASIQGSIRLLWKLLLSGDFEGVKKEVMKFLNMGYKARTIFLDLLDFLIYQEIEGGTKFFTVKDWRFIVEMARSDFLFESEDVNKEFKSLMRILGLIRILLSSSEKEFLQ